jgi:hypothetical protein
MAIPASLYRTLGISEEVIKSSSRVQEVQIARMALYYHLRKKGYTLQQIGREFNRSHSAVLSALLNVDRALEIRDSRVTSVINMIAGYRLRITDTEAWLRKADKHIAELKKKIEELANELKFK